MKRIYCRRQNLLNPGDKNSSGGEVLDVLTFGNLRVIYETFWWTFLQKRIVIWSGSEVVASLSHVDNEDAFEDYWRETAEFISSFDTSGGEAGYYKYLNSYDKVKEGVVNILRKWSSRLSEGKYDPVDGRRLDASSKIAQGAKKVKVRANRKVVKADFDAYAFRARHKAAIDAFENSCQSDTSYTGMRYSEEDLNDIEEQLSYEGYSEREIDQIIADVLAGRTLDYAMQNLDM